MKRSRSINLTQMRKAAERTLSGAASYPGGSRPGTDSTLPRGTFAQGVRAVAVLLGASCFMGCAEEEVQIVATIEECIQKTALNPQECEAAYMKAVAEAEHTGPRYNSRSSCEEEFGYSRCDGAGDGFFMPMMAGFMIGNMMGGHGYNPVYRYGGYNSRLNGSYMTAGGSVIGRPGKSSYRVSTSSLKPQPRSVKTVSRGGFGAKASARSSWGSSRGSRGWGG